MEEGDDSRVNNGEQRNDGERIGVCWLRRVMHSLGSVQWALWAPRTAGFSFGAPQNPCVQSRMRDGGTPHSDVPRQSGAENQR